MVYHDQSIVRLMWNLALSVFAGKELRNKYSLYWPGSLWYGSSFRYGTKPFYHRAVSFDGRRRIELGLLRSGTLLWRSALCWLWLLRVFLEQCEWLHSKMRAHYLEGDESLCDCIFHVQTKKWQWKNRRQSGLSLPGWKNCRGLLLMQSEVQKPVWSSVLG